MKIQEATPDSDVWPSVAGLFPEAVSWMSDPSDDGDYHFLAAIGDSGEFIGGSVIEISNLYFGPLSKVRAGFLENIEVGEAHRRKGIGAALLRGTLDLAWESGCESVRWTVDYDNEAGLALYRSQGLGFVPEEDPEAPGEPDTTYTIVAINPQRVKEGYGNEN